MSKKQTDFLTLSEEVISELKGLGYMDSSLTNYRRLYRRVGSLMEEHAVKEYSPDWGKAFIDEYYPCDNDRRRMVSLMIRRIDDYLNDIPYRCHRAMKKPNVPPTFAGLLDDYQEYCKGIGNKPETVRIKKDFCLIFLQFLSDIGCNNIFEITAEIVAKSCLNYTNKDGYAVLRQFLRYLFEKSLISTDLSAIVPHHKRRQNVPSVFMPECVSSALKAHISINDPSLMDGYVFHSMSAPYGSLTTSIIRHIVKVCIVSAAIDVKGKKHGPHAFRYSLASNLVSGGTSYDTVRKILGHTDPDAVKHYVKTDIERLRKCALSPPEPTGVFLDLLCGRRHI